MTLEIFTNDFTTTIVDAISSTDTSLVAVNSPSNLASSVAIPPTQYHALIDTSNGVVYYNTEIVTITNMAGAVWQIERATESVSGGVQQGAPVAHDAGVDITLVVTADVLAALASGGGGSASVTSVFGRGGAVVAQSSDYAAYYDALGSAAAASAASDAYSYGLVKAASVQIPSPVVNTVEGLSGSVTFYSPNATVGITTSGASIGFTAAGGGGGGSVNSVFGRTGVVTAQSGDYAAFYDPLGSAAAGSVNAVNVSESYTFQTVNSASTAAIATSESYAYGITKAASVQIPAPVVNAVEGLSGSVTFYSPNAAGITFNTSGASVGFVTAASVNSVFGRIGTVTAQASDYSNFYDANGQAANASIAAINSAFGTTQAASIAAIAVAEAYADNSAHAASVAATAASDPLGYASAASTAAISVSETYAYGLTKAASVASIQDIYGDVVATGGGSVSGTLVDTPNVASIIRSNSGYTVVQKTGNYTANPGEVVAASVSATAASITVPSTLDAVTWVGKIDGSANMVTVVPSSGLINNAATYVISGPNQFYNFVGDGTNVRVVSGFSPASDITLDQFGAPVAAVAMGSQNFTGLAPAIAAAQVPTIGQLAGNQYAYVVSGCIWTPDSAGASLNGSMTPGVVSIGGIQYSVASVGHNAFTASKDTYVDIYYVSGTAATVAYTAVANNATSPPLVSSNTVQTAIRCAVITSGGSSIASQAKICQGDPLQATPATTAATSTVALGSNGANINASTLAVAANSLAPAGMAIVDTSAGTGAGFGSVITYTSGGGTTTLSGVTLLLGSGTVSTGGAVTQLSPISTADSLGNPIYPTSPNPTLIAVGRLNSGAVTTTSTSGVPVGGIITPFIVPPGTSRRVKFQANIPWLLTSAAAGSTIESLVQYATVGGSLLSANSCLNALSVTSDGFSVQVFGAVLLTPGSYIATIGLQQSAAGTLTFGKAYYVPQLTVELE